MRDVYAQDVCKLHLCNYTLRRYIDKVVITCKEAYAKVCP